MGVVCCVGEVCYVGGGGCCVLCGGGVCCVGEVGGVFVHAYVYMSALLLCVVCPHKYFSCMDL